MLRLLFSFILLPSAALAHPGHSTGTLSHFLSEPDHVAGLVLLVAVVAGAIVMVRRRNRERDHDSR